RTRAQASRIGAVHALILAHQPSERAVGELVLVEADQIVVVPLRIRHGLIRVVEGGLAERVGVPFDASHLARLAADAGRDVDQLADAFGFFALRALARGRARMAGDRFDLECPGAHARSSFTRKPLNSGVYALGSITVGERRLAGVNAVLPSSSLMPQ